MNTCDGCKRYVPPDKRDLELGRFKGQCDLMNMWAYNGVAYAHSATAWDAENFSCGVHVGPKFGCIHFEPKEG